MSLQPLWLALLPPQTERRHDDSTQNPLAAVAADQATAVAWWALQFTPKVAFLDDAIVAEVSASARLFGGQEALRSRLLKEAVELGCAQVAWAPSAHAAVAFARTGIQDGLALPLQKRLDALPLAVVPAVCTHAGTLARTGCKTLGDVRRLPRGGLSRRFGKPLLLSIDQTYGLQPTAFAWVTAPDTFSARLELPGRVDAAEALMFGAQRLLTQMAGWLAARHSGVRTFHLRWKYDFHKASDVPDWGELTIGTASVTRETTHFSRLLREQLGHVRLGASVDELILVAGEVAPLEEVSGELLLDKERNGEPHVQLFERLSARFGTERIVRAAARSDYRPEHSQEWTPAVARPSAASPALPQTLQPTWLLDAPLKLAARKGLPIYHGALEQIAGPYRVEAGWWDREQAAAVETNSAVATRRDYFVMASETAGLLWVFRDLAAMAPDAEWYLHGVFG